jgi:tubulin polyglutamylase TTLL6/13
LGRIAETEGQEAVDNLWIQMKDIIVKTLLVGLPHLAHNYKTCRSKSSYPNFRQCFQILGFDIMLDKKLKPWLLEVNESPSFNDDTEVDKFVKTGLIESTFRLLDFKKSNKNHILGMDKNKSVIQRNKLQHMSEQEILEN